jgi:hypothetical protein
MSVKQRVALPNGVELVGETVHNVISNFLKARTPSVTMPSTFQLARLVTGELGPLVMVEEEK